MAKVRVQITRKFVPHRLLLDAAAKSLEAGKEKKIGYFWDDLSAILYCSLSIEAIGNSYGQTFIPRWNDFMKVSPQVKIRLVAEKAGLNPDFATQPWCVVPRLLAFRNGIAHAKPEDVRIDEVRSPAAYEALLYSKPPSKLESMVTRSFAQTAYDQVSEILNLFAANLPSDELHQLELLQWSGSASAM